MIRIIFLISVISLLFAGCSKEAIPELIPIIKIKKQVIKLPIIDEAPLFVDYKYSIIKFNKKSYYLLTIEDGLTMKNNYNRYKLWSEHNYSILIYLKNKYKEEIND